MVYIINIQNLNLIFLYCMLHKSNKWMNLSIVNIAHSDGIELVRVCHFYVALNIKNFTFRFCTNVGRLAPPQPLPSKLKLIKG
jgi:hypothetical protein